MKKEKDQMVGIFEKFSIHSIARCIFGVVEKCFSSSSKSIFENEPAGLREPELQLAAVIDFKHSKQVHTNLVNLCFLVP
ncbi:hypothetical protein T05_3676 [Trichinella murrelli]|uniref:Uncharacterized protein n=1 Tax=Trichinella murrelli TaxID=144512 RepID=A0A0V0TLH1_9BILA|nr:hypothetical protein T05_3676 [Trichinella murrelli]